MEYKESTAAVELLLRGYVFITQAPNVKPALLHHRLPGHAVAVLSLRLFSHLQWPFLICLCYAALRECEELSKRSHFETMELEGICSKLSNVPYKVPLCSGSQAVSAFAYSD